MNYKERTMEYYSQWTDADISVLKKPGITKIASKKRDEIPQGHSKSSQLWCFIYGQSIVISYSKTISNSIEETHCIFKNNNDIGLVIKKLEQLFDKKVGHSIKYYFSGKQNPCDVTQVQRLVQSDYEQYERFFKEIHPISNTTGWLKDYFAAIVNRELMYGLIKDNKFVSVTDAPEIPYYKESIVEPGINTLANYRQKGYAKMVCTAMIRKILDNQMIPIWSCGSYNTASQKLAESLGYRRLGEVISISIGK